MGWSESDRDGEDRDAVLEFRKNELHIAADALLDLATAGAWLPEEQLEAALGKDDNLTPTFALALDGVIEQLSARNRGGIWPGDEARLARAWDAWFAIDCAGEHVLHQARRANRNVPHGFEARSGISGRCRLCLEKAEAQVHAVRGAA